MSGLGKHVVVLGLVLACGSWLFFSSKNNLAPFSSPLATSSAVSDLAEIEEDDDKTQGASSYYRDRLYPFEEIPKTAKEKAFRSFQQLKQLSLLSANQTARLWTPIGPAPIVTAEGNNSGRVVSIGLHPSDPNTVYVGAAQGGVWKSINGGESWAPLTDNQPSLAMGVVAIDPKNPNTVYAGTGEANFSGGSYAGAGLLKSLDAGASWKLIPVVQAQTPSNKSAMTFSSIIFDPTNTNTLYAATTYRGTGGFGRGSKPSNEPYGIFKSTDAGLTWNRLLAGIATDIIIDPTNPSVLYAGIGATNGDEFSFGVDNGIYKSTDGGANWMRLAGGLPKTDFGRVELALAPSASTTLYAAFQDSTRNRFGTLLSVMKSTDAGATWNALTIPSDSLYEDPCTFREGSAVRQCWRDLILAIGPKDPNEVWIGGVGFFKSSDGGSSWTEMQQAKQLHVDFQDLAFGPDGRLWALNDGGIWYTLDGGANWVNRNTNISVTQYYPGVSLHPKNPELALGGTQDNGTTKFTGSLSWERIFGGDGAFTAIDPNDPDNAWFVSTQNLGIRKTVNGGRTFTSAISGINRQSVSFIAPFVMCPNNSKILIAGTSKIYRTENGAGSWTANSPDFEDPQTRGSLVTALAFAPSDPDCKTYIAGTNRGKVFVTSDAGAKWADATTGLTNRFTTDLAFHPTDANVAYAVFSGFLTGHIFKTTNALSANPIWVNVSSNLPDIPFNAIVIDPPNPNTLYAGADIGVYRSTDGGATWMIFGEGLPNSAVFDLVLHPTTGVLVAATHGRGMFKMETK